MAPKNHHVDLEKQSYERHRSRSQKTSQRPQKSKNLKSSTNHTGSELCTKPRRKSRGDLEGDQVKINISEPNLMMAESIVPELSRASSRNSFPYPSFDKTFSKESVHMTRDNSNIPEAKSPFTPVMTDLSTNDTNGIKPNGQPQILKNERPPSPPDTDIANQKKPSPKIMSQVKEDSEEKEGSDSRTSVKSKFSKGEVQSILFTTSTGSLESDSKIIDQNISENNDSDPVKKPVTISEIESKSKLNITAVQDSFQKNVDNPKRHLIDTNNPSFPSDSLTSFTKTHDLTPPCIKQLQSHPVEFDDSDLIAKKYDSIQRPASSQKSQQIDLPKIDYLLQNGGLQRQISKKLVSHTPPTSQKLNTLLPPKLDQVFGPCLNILDQYESVLMKNGSLAVATGYRSVARRLLDRLEIVMGRSLSADGCLCLMCKHLYISQTEKPKALGWGEVLEWSAGRKELPVWPTFDFSTVGVKIADEILNKKSFEDPVCSSLPIDTDSDITSEFCEYYLKQSKSTRLAVDKWLSSCPAVATPPQEIDDETLSFSILTHLHKSERSLFNALVTGSTSLKSSTLALPSHKKLRSEFLLKTAVSIRRLYRLPITPRNPEAAIYMLKNPELHNLLAAISEINAPEWEILTSGRFDGFLWSGADHEYTSSSPVIDRSPSISNDISNQKAKYSSNPLARSFSTNDEPQTYPRDSLRIHLARRPVLNDEETEINVLAEIEREIFLGMEALEDAFETLHRKAELVRRALRERGSSLALSLHLRKNTPIDSSNTEINDVQNSGLGIGYERLHNSESFDIYSDNEWDLGDELSELAPDDSASNISRSRKRRPNRRNQTRPPVLLEEDNER